MVTKGMSLIKVPLKDGRAVPLIVEPFQTAIGIDIDCPNRQIYWSDVATGAIKVASFNGSDKGTFLDEGKCDIICIIHLIIKLKNNSKAIMQTLDRLRDSALTPFLRTFTGPTPTKTQSRLPV